MSDAYQRLLIERYRQIEEIKNARREGFVHVRLHELKEETKDGVLQLGAIDITVHTITTSNGIEQHVVHTVVHD